MNRVEKAISINGELTGETLIEDYCPEDRIAGMPEVTCNNEEDCRKCWSEEYIEPHVYTDEELEYMDKDRFCMTFNDEKTELKFNLPEHMLDKLGSIIITRLGEEVDRLNR